MMETAKYLSNKVGQRIEAAGADEKTTPQYYERVTSTMLDVATTEIDQMRAQLRAIALAATVGTLTPIGYKNALKNVRYLAEKALDR